MPGLVRLQERATGKVLHEADLEMVQMMTNVTWSDDHVSIMLIAEWDLPSPTDPLGGGASK